MDDRPIKLPLRAVLIDVFGALLCAIGVHALLAESTMPTWLAIVFVGAGAGLMLYGMSVILRRMRASR